MAPTQAANWSGERGGDHGSLGLRRAQAGAWPRTACTSSPACAAAPTARSAKPQSEVRAEAGCTLDQVNGIEIVPAPVARTARSAVVGGSRPSRTLRSTVTPKNRVAGAALDAGAAVDRSAGDRTTAR